MSSNGSTGQILGYVVGAVVGYFTGGAGYVALGATLGGAAGAALDPPKLPKLYGPRLDDLTVQTSTQGAVIPRVYGTVAVTGNVFWLEGDKLREIAVKKKSGGKGGGGGQTSYTFYYFATFAVGLCEGPIAGVRRIWIGNKLWYDAGSEDLGTVLASNQSSEKFRIYYGTETQEPEPRMQADKGAANVSAHRGLAYLVFYDFPLADYGNSLLGAQVKVEVVKAANPPGIRLIASNTVGSNRIAPSRSGVVQSLGPNGEWTTMQGEPVATPAPDWGALVQTFADGASRTLPGLYDAMRYTPYYVGPLPAGTEARYAQWFGVGGNWFKCPGGDSFTWATTQQSAAFISPFLYAIRPERISIGQSYALVKCFASAQYPERDFTVAAMGVMPLADVEFCPTPHDGALYLLVEPGTLRARNLETLGVMQDYALPVSISSSGARSKLVSEGGGLWVFDSADNVLYKLSPDFESLDDQYQFPNYTESFYDISINGSLVGITYYGGETVTRRVFALGSTMLGDLPLVPLSEIISAEAAQIEGIEPADIDVTEMTDEARGYRVASVAAVRSAIEPLQASWPFDVVQSGYTVAFRRRGRAPAVTIDASELDARPGSDAPGVQITNSREMDTQIARRVSIKYLDNAREYDNGEQYAERIATTASNVRELELPLVLTATEAAQKAEVLLYLYWLERHDISFRLPPAYAYLEPADVITITSPSATYEVRLTQVNYRSDGILECAGKYNSAAIYSPAAIGEESSTLPDPFIPLRGPTGYQLLDVPALTSSMDTPAFLAAAWGLTGGWPGGSILRSTDNGQSFSPLQGFADPVTAGECGDPIAAAPSSVIDAASVLAVRLYGGELESVSELAMLNGANHFAYGRDGRWEVIAARTCELQPDGTYRLRDLLRGRFGSEWAGGLHERGDLLILLTDADLALVGSDPNTIGQARQYKGVTIGEVADNVDAEAFAYRGVNLECLSPVYLRGWQDTTSGDWSFDWIRRTRIGGEWRDNVDASLGEASEAYEIVIGDGGFEVEKRVIATTSPSASYTDAQQVADFGGTQSVLYVTVYQISATMGRGYPLRGVIETPGVVTTDVLITESGAPLTDEAGTYFVAEFT